MCDWRLALGIAVDALERISRERPDLEIRLNDGLLSIGYKGEAPKFSAGCKKVPPTVDNWQDLVATVSRLPKIG